MPPHNIHQRDTYTVADAILQLDYESKLNTTNNYTHAMLGVELRSWARNDGSCLHTTGKTKSYNKSSAST